MSEYQWKDVSVIGFDELMNALDRADRKGYMPDALKEEWEAFNWKPAQQQEPEFFTHNVEQPYDWSEWVCPDSKSYLMKCCDCGLVHEAQFGVVRYRSETEREDCDFVDDPNLQAVFRMRRSEQWSPADTAQRAGGLPMADEQPAQQCRTDGRCQYAIDSGAEGMGHCPKGKCVMPAQQEPVDLEAVYETIIRWDIGGGKRSRRELSRRIVALYTSPPANKPLTGEQEHEVIGTAGVDLLELAKLWSDNKIHVYQFDNEARKIIKGVLHRAHGIKENT